jgi:DNA-binding MarR family transcriptional regulator
MRAALRRAKRGPAGDSAAVVAVTRVKPDPAPVRMATAGSRMHTPDASEAPARVLQQFRIVFNAVKAHFQQVERKAGVGGAQVWALSVIRDRPGIGVNDLAAALNIRQPTASNLVKSLSRQALIEVRREGVDRRAVQLHATLEARKVLRRAPGPFTGVLPEALAGLDPKTLRRLEADLNELIGRLDTDEAAAKIPLAHL